MLTRTSFRLVAVALLTLASGCDSSSHGSGTLAGSERGPCLPCDRCNPGFVCRDRICVPPDDAGLRDRGPNGPEGPPKPDGPKLARCKDPGQPCKALDPCAIEASCGQDGLCRATKLQSCDDGLPCTEDVCRGLGVCDRTPTDGFCVISEVGSDGKKQRRCVARGQAATGIQCMVCDDTREKFGWSPIDGTFCDDGEPCTKSDTCQGGLCVGVYFGDKCADGLGCTDDLCDGKGGCSGNTLRPDWCKIDNLCYHHGETDLTGCKTCDVSQSQSAWTTPPALCTIDGKCYPPGAKEPGGCGACDPKKSTTGWTPQPSPCLISGECFLSGAKDPTGCASCDPSAPNLWTVVPTKCLIHRVCRSAGELAPGGCASCDPSQSALGWTPNTASCLIGGACIADGTEQGNGCLRCDRAKDGHAWTASGSASIVGRYGFETGVLGGWNVTSSSPLVRWSVSDRRSGAGAFALYYGNPAAGNFRTEGAPNSGTATLGPIALPPGKAGMLLSLYLDTESGTAYDLLTISVNGSKVWAKSATTPSCLWQTISVNLTAYAGQSVTVSIKFDTVDQNLNSGEGVFVDDLTVYGGC